MKTLVLDTSGKVDGKVSIVEVPDGSADEMPEELMIKLMQYINALSPYERNQLWAEAAFSVKGV